MTPTSSEKPCNAKEYAPVFPVESSARRPSTTTSAGTNGATGSKSCSFGSLKDWRRVATRYDRYPKVFLSTIALAAIVIYWLRDAVTGLRHARPLPLACQTSTALSPFPYLTQMEDDGMKLFILDWVCRWRRLQCVWSASMAR